MLNVLLIGSGGVGTIASLVLEKSKLASVTSVLRSNYEIVKEEGFDIESVDHGRIKGWRPSKIVRTVPTASPETPYDFVVVTLKALPDIYSIPTIISPAITPNHTSIVLIQNGLDIDLPISTAFPTNPVMSGVSMIGSRVSPPGNHVYHEDPDSVIIGAHLHHVESLDASLQIAKAKLFVDVYSKGLPGSDTAEGRFASCTFTDDITKARWRKLLWNGTFNTLCTLTRLSVGDLQLGGGTASLLIPAMKEMLSLANAAGYTYPEDTIEDLVAGTLPTSPFRPSMLVDLDNGRPLEVQVILGAPLRRAKELSVSTPVLGTVFELLELVQWKGLHEKGQGVVASSEE